MPSKCLKDNFSFKKNANYKLKSKVRKQKTMIWDLFSKNYIYFPLID